MNTKIEKKEVKNGPFPRAGYQVGGGDRLSGRRLVLVADGLVKGRVGLQCIAPTNWAAHFGLHSFFSSRLIAGILHSMSTVKPRPTEVTLKYYSGLTRPTAAQARSRCRLSITLFAIVQIQLP